MTEKPLFLPLSGLWYDEFVSGRKTREIRGMRGQYNTSTVRVGREVIISRGYGKQHRTLGVITKVDTFLNVNIFELPKDILRDIVPDSVKNDPKVIEYINMYNQKYSDFIVFKIEIKRW
jgi:hypothetical protein